MRLYREDQLDQLPETGGVYVMFFASMPHIGYIGSTSNFRKRAKQHFSKLRRGTHSNFKLKRIYKTRSNELTFGILENLLDIPYARTREQVYLDFYPRNRLLNLDFTVYSHSSDK